MYKDHNNFRGNIYHMVKNNRVKRSVQRLKFRHTQLFNGHYFIQDTVPVENESFHLAAFPIPIPGSGANLSGGDETNEPDRCFS